MTWPNSLPQRFRAKLIAAPSGCWIWAAGQCRDGYGRYRATPDRTGEVRAHRFSYEALAGPIPAGFVIDHLCRVRACVNPLHLQPVTDKTNVMRSLGRCAQNARKTHCPQGHEYDEANTFIRRSGRRRCRTCQRAADRARSRTRGGAR